jgi:hypothetical protein
VLGMEKDKRQKETEINSLVELMQKRDTEIDELEVILSDDGQLERKIDFLLEEKAKSILDKYDY